jgi:predicted membrane-bound spermidine synthase
MMSETNAERGAQRAASISGAVGRPGALTLVTAFTLTTFLSALLLFSIQPMFAKMVLPILGGAPSVWAVALCFFQGALLAGYCYAHALNRYVPARYAGLVHLAVFLLAMTALPIGLPAGWREPPPGDPYLWQMGLFTVAVGLPFVAIAANAPLLQAWFARTGHPDGKDPYFLYGASNLGSFFALIAYPLLLEPQFGLTALSRQWTLGFVLLGFAIAVCFWLLRLSNDDAPATTSTAASPPAGAASEAPSWTARLGWIGLALVPSALLTAYTTHIATDVASAPLIWVGPLSLYLLTFVLVFRDRPVVFLPCLLAAAAAGYGLVPPLLFALPGLASLTQPSWFPVVGAAVTAALFAWAYRKPWLSPSQWLLAFHLGALVLALLQLSQTRHDNLFISASTGVAAFFLSALVAHRTLYDARPRAEHLTEFYLWMSLGGVLGGLFAALIAPQLFSEVLEYPILLALTMACRPGAMRISLKDRDELLWLWLIAAAGLLAVWWSRLIDLEDKLYSWSVSLADGLTFLGLGKMLSVPLRQMYLYGVAAVICLVCGALVIYWRRQPARQMFTAFVMCLAIILLPSSVKRSYGHNAIAERSYFGVYRVSVSHDRQYQVLTHGTTLHGAQRIMDNTGAIVNDTTPGTYYHPESPMAKTVELVRERLASASRKGRYGVVGLGTGSLACYAKEGEQWRFFEIDPVIVGIASDATRFSFVHNCQPRLDLVLGDARLTIAKEPDGTYDLIIVDAFSSDAIPVHLLTADAIRLYKSKLKPDGTMLLHISNRYLDLDSVVAATAGLVPDLDGLLLVDNEADGSYASTQSTAAVLSRDKAVLEPFRKLEMAKELEATTMRGWTDDFSDILAPFMSRWRGRR